MNILFLLTPKAKCAYLRAEDTVRQALERMESSGYAALPILAKDGTYKGTLTEGDLLWAFKNSPGFSFMDAEKMMLSDIPRHFHYETVAIDQPMDSLIGASYRQSFVPVVDDNEIFIGLIKRSDIIRYFYRRYQQANQ